MPFILGAIVGHKTQDIDQGGFDLEHDFLAKAGLDLSGASQADGAGRRAIGVLHAGLHGPIPSIYGETKRFCALRKGAAGSRA